MITLFDVRQKLNNQILHCSDLKFTSEIEPLQIDSHIINYSNILFSKCDQYLNHICIKITYDDKRTKSNNHIIK